MELRAKADEIGAEVPHQDEEDHLIMIVEDEMIRMIVHLVVEGEIVLIMTVPAEGVLQVVMVVVVEAVSVVEVEEEVVDMLKIDMIMMPLVVLNQNLNFHVMKLVEKEHIYRKIVNIN